MTSFPRILLLSAALTLVFASGLFVGREILPASSQSPLQLTSVLRKDQLTFKTVEGVWNLLNTEYVGAGELDRQAVLSGAIRGMLDALGDPYTVFFDEKETRQFLQGLSGTFEGVGIEVALQEKGLTIITPLKDSPAQRAGVQAGDIILAIDGEGTEEMSLDDAVTRIRGTRGTQVTLRVLRGEVEQDIVVTRDTITVPSVRSEMRDSVAYIEILQFSEDTPGEFEAAAKEALRQDASSVVVDVRYNPGGYLESAVDVAGWFMPRNSLVVTEREGNGETRQHRTDGPASFAELPIIILQNEGSASASEILAGALRDNRSAVIVGKKSFGKGTVQTLESLDGGTSVKLTIARWITPSGVEINGTGIEAGVVVEDNPDTPEDEQLLRALEIARQ